jgi:hypothetical protein
MNLDNRRKRVSTHVAARLSGSHQAGTKRDGSLYASPKRADL